MMNTVINLDRLSVKLLVIAKNKVNGQGDYYGAPALLKQGPKNA